MKVFFTCSTKRIKDHSEDYRVIRDEIINLSHKINRDWIDYSINVAQRGIPDVPTETIYDDVMSAIMTADAIVVDASVRSMSLGHQLTYALLKNKPVLLIRRLNKKAKRKLFIEGSGNNNLTTGEYETKKDIQGLLKNFFNKYDDKTQRRFNLVISGGQDSYISWSAFHNKKTKTEVIQDAIDKMASKDTGYKEYLSRQN